MAEQDGWGLEYLQQAVVIVEKFEVLVAACQFHASGQFYRHTKEDQNQLSKSWARRSLHPQDCEFFRKDEAAARSSFRSLLLASSARRQTRERLLRSFETEDGGEKPRVAARPETWPRPRLLFKELTMSDRILVMGATGLQAAAGLSSLETRQP